MLEVESDRTQIVQPYQPQLGRRAAPYLGHTAGFHPWDDNCSWPDGASHFPGRRLPHRPESHRCRDGGPSHRTTRDLPTVELHRTTADSDPDLSMTPGACFVTPPNEASLGPPSAPSGRECEVQ